VSGVSQAVVLAGEGETWTEAAERLRRSGGDER